MFKLFDLDLIVKASVSIIPISSWRRVLQARVELYYEVFDMMFQSSAT